MQLGSRRLSSGIFVEAWDPQAYCPLEFTCLDNLGDLAVIL